ncbi:MAG: hypothetical protein Q9195_006806 [Heterodermia aff. obscurata]
MSSHSLDSCVPAPICKSQDYKLTSLDGITSNTQYLGDASTSNWVSSGTPKVYNDQVLLTLSEDGASSSGTLLASASYVWYGKISAQMKSSRGDGVVSAFILLSDVKDEIDFEFVGKDLAHAQSNYYFQGITDYDNEKDLAVDGGSTFDDYHTYEIDWQPDQLTWAVDGTVMRTLKKSDTFNKTTNQYHYPQTPSRVQLSLWPAGLSKNGQGTVEWAGGLIDWNSQDIQANGYYYSMFKDITVECYDAPKDANVTGDTSYIYTKNDGIESSVATTNDDTVLKSLLGTGTDMDKDYPSAAASASASGSAAASDVATVPGLSGAGPGTNGQRGNSGDDSSGSTGSSGSSGASGVSSAVGSSSTGFVQGDGGGAGNNAPVKSERILQGSVFAALVAIAGMLVL